ncbi:E3 ubiquitin-protein ligase RNF19B-like [Actinia tenebrosa]|uniref:E3 ubiquitin-protein ligase RNF19B-like n=1 Tax=Actinia tenebrosa TaxID=6105 RepID=A0A6P8HQ05_ACTTE|nr:E3 ubiquitin-protein ligase RNF19B-like [Actinia tenebrosa]XP_031554717.1 E3 ubiquitin-protein ligase RNF19B-like [Actinia tenebrosa]
MADEKERHCLSCQEKDFLIMACNDDCHHLCLQCLSLWLRSKTNEPDSFNYQCPLYDECHSSFDPDTVNDILVQLPDNSQGVTSKDVQKLSVNSAVRSDKKVSCPNCAFFWTEDEDFVELFANCSACKTAFCLTCEHILGPYSHLDHVCPLDNNSKNERKAVAEILSEASTFKCKNPNCEYSRAGTCMAKQEGDCNVIRCSSCKIYYCYICSKSLGFGKIRAHESFPHENSLIPGAPNCWIFDEIAFNHTTEEASNLRKLHQLSKYFSSLPISKKAKQVVLAQCRDLVGDLSEKIVLELNESTVNKCTIL